MAKVPQEGTGGQVLLDGWRTEIDGYFEIMRDFPNLSPIEDEASWMIRKLSTFFR